MRVGFGLAQAYISVGQRAIGICRCQVIVGVSHVSRRQLVFVDETAKVARVLKRGVAEQRMVEWFDVGGCGANTYKAIEIRYCCQTWRM